MAAKKKDKKERDAADTHSLPDHTKEQLDLPLKGSPDLTGQSKEQLISKLQDLQIHLEMQAEELRRSHLALEVSRDKYLDLYDFAPLGYLTLNDNALITDVNLTGAMLLGAERNEIINHRFEQFIAPEDFERWYQFFANIQRQHVKKQVCTFVFIRENGSTFPAQLEGVRTISSDGAIEIHIAISDITDIREAEKALRESEEKYRVIFEKSVNGLFKITHEGALIAVNDAFARIYDYSSAAEMTADNQTRENLYISRSLYANPEDRKEIYRILAEKGKVENFETLHCKRDGTRIWISITARVVRDPEGTILFIEGTVIDITKRKQAEDALRESHDRFKATIASLDDAIFLVDPVTRLIIECNDASTRIFGCSREELIGKGTGFLHVDQAHLEQFSREVNATYKEPGFYTREFEMRRKNGDVFPTEHFVRPIHDPNGRILYVVSVVRDISGRKQAEEALRESESFNRGLVENLPDYIIVYRPDGKILYANPATVKGFGYNLNELVGTSVISYVAPECRTRVTAAIATRFKGDDPPEYETVLITKEGQRKTVIAKGTLVRYHDGLATLLLLTDITERKVAEEALQTLNAYNRNLLEASLDSLVTINSEGKIADVNASTEKITGCSREELIGTDFSDYFTEPEQAKRGYQRVFADGTVRNYPLNIRNRDGHITPVLYNATVYRDDKGDITGVFAAARDITERKRTEEALREGEERFRGLIDTITSGVAIYEVRNNGASGKDYIIKDFNKTALEIEGENKEDVIGKSLFDLRPTIDEYGLIQVFQHVWETGVPAYFPQKVYIDEKYSRWYENRVFRLQSGEIVAIYDDITELKQAEEALRESHDRFEATIASLDEAIFLVDPVTRLIIECNDASTRIFGCSREELIGKGTGFLHVDQAHLEQFSREVNATYKEPGFYTREFEMRRKNGDVFPTEHFVRPIHDPNGRILYVVSVVRDITGRKLAEEKLSKMMRQQKIILDIAPVGISLIVDRKQIWVNPKTEDLFQYSKEELEGQTTRKLYPSEEAYEKVGRDAYPVLAQGHTYETEQQLIRRDRTPIWVRYNGMAIEPADLMKGTIWLLEDITERKRAEEALRQSEEKFRTLFESMVPGVFYQRSDGALIDANPAALSMFGLSREQFLDRDSYDPRWKVVSEAGELLLPEHYPSMIALRSGKLVKDQIVGVYNPERDDMVWLSTNAEPQFRRGEATPYQVFVIMYDITERKKAEQTIQHALAEKEVLLREIHHRVKNNLAGILSLIELQTSSLSDPVQIAPFKDLETRIRSMALVHESLSKTKDPARIYFVSYTENLTRYLLPAYGTAGEVKCKIEMGYITLPIETATPCGLVMNEIITNSLKHAFPKTFNCGEIRGEPCTISITLNRDGSDYLLGVSDNGIGMPEGIDVTISHTLGLFLIRFIVEHQLRGSLEISNEGGTAYTIRFPEPKVKERNTNEKM